MKILKKSEVQAESNKARQEQIDEGVALATKLDDLRSNLAKLEAQHTAYIAGMKASLEKEIGPLVIERNELKANIEKATEELRRLRIPLDKEWEAVRADRDSIDKRLRALEIKEQELIEVEKTIESDRENVEYEKAVAASLKEEAMNDVSLAQAWKTSSDVILQKTTTLCEKRVNELDERERELGKWERELEMREVDMSNKQDSMTEREADMTRREIVLKDRYDTLERTINQLKK